MYHRGMPISVLRTVLVISIAVGVAGCDRSDDTPPNPRIDPAITAPDGFDVELLHEVDAETEGSWVALCAGPDGTLYAADQYGGLYRITPPALDDFESPPAVTPLPLPLNGAQGLLYAFEALYVMETGRGLLRVTDTDGDGEVDTSDLIVEVRGAGEHGTHAIVPHPDGASLLIVCGNHTPLPASLTASRVPRVWGEDQLLPRDPDPRGHATGYLAPGGYVCRVSPDGREVELIACGFRNSYDLAAAPNGEIFAFDSDMEWDLGLPWYRPARVNHVVSGADFGWRYGSGKWPGHHEDTFPAVVDIGPASPTGMLFGTDAEFPASYRRAMYLLDWTYGIIYAAHLEPDGATFTARVEQFITGKPLPLTDAAVAADGAMYFATGGRRLASRLYRVVYRGDERTDPAPGPAEVTPETRARRSLEAMHAESAKPDRIDSIWNRLADDDRAVRHAARVALEHVPVSVWRDRARSETDEAAASRALLALARHAEPSDAEAVFRSLLALDPSDAEPATRLAILRAYELAMIRLGMPEGDQRERVIAHVERFTGSEAIELETARLLVALQHPGVIDRCLHRLSDTRARTPASWGELARQNDQYGSAIRGMLDRPPPTAAIAYANALSSLRTGWTFQQRQAFFTFLQRATASAGGMSYRGYIDAIRQRALESCTDLEREALAPLLVPIETGDSLPPIVFPAGPWRSWTVEDAARATEDLSGSSFARGGGLYRATACASCHQMNGAGGNAGPDLSSVGQTYSRPDLLRAIIEPSHAISDQYAVSVIHKADGSTVSGLIVGLDDHRVTLAPNFGAAAFTTEIPRAEVRKITVSDTSPMPAGLVNGLNGGELRDLLAYLVSGADPEDPVFGP
jgi:putative heme-binding domain-containing protein